MQSSSKTRGGVIPALTEPEFEIAELTGEVSPLGIDAVNVRTPGSLVQGIQ